MKKKFFAVLTALFLLCACLPLGATSVSAAALDDIRYEINGGEVIITDCYAKATLVMIPSTIEGCPVTTIGENAFFYCLDLESVTIPDSVTTIESNAFSDCESLKSVTIGSGVTTIGNFAFSGCDSLTDLYYIGNKTDRAAIQIGEHNDALDTATWHYYEQENKGTTGACTWTLDDNGHLTISGKGAMGDYSSKLNSGFNHTDAPWGWHIKSVTIEDGVTTIGKSAFAGCVSLESVTIPDSVTTMDKWAFDVCVSLTAVTIGDGVTTIGYGAFNQCISLTSVIIPDSVTIIDEWAFCSCKSLKSVTIGAGVTTVRECAFYACDALTDVHYTGDETAHAAIQIDDNNSEFNYATWHYHPVVEQPSTNPEVEDNDHAGQDPEIEDNDDHRDNATDSTEEKDAETEDKDKDKNEEGGSLWLWIGIGGGVVLLVVVVLVVLKKKKSAE